MENLNENIALLITDETPFAECFSCRSFCKDCRGPNIMSLGVDGACEFLQLTRIFLKLSYQDISDGTGISLSTVKRTLTKKVGEPNFYTVVKINNFLMGHGGGEQKPCAIPNTPTDSSSITAAATELERVLADNQDYKVALDNIHASYNAEMKLIRAEAQKQIDFLLRQNEFFTESLKAKDKQLDHRAHAMMEKEDTIKWHREEVIELKELNKKLLEKYNNLKKQSAAT